MSSTNRGGQRSPSDNYPTPTFCVHRLLEGAELPGGLWYEPCAGEGAIIAAVNEVRNDVQWVANEIRKGGHHELMRRLGHLPSFQANCGDALDDFAFPDRKVDVVITNPPFFLAMELIQTLMRQFPHAHVVQLLRMNFWGTKKRQPFFEKYPPDMYVLPNRPSFKGEGKTDSIEYAWFVWEPAPRAREFGRVKVLPLTHRADQATPAITGTEFVDSTETP